MTLIANQYCNQINKDCILFTQPLTKSQNNTDVKKLKADKAQLDDIYVYEIRIQHNSCKNTIKWP